MKKAKKLLALLLAGVTIMSATGCGAKKVEDVESDKTQLYVGIYAGGIGDEWLKKAIDRFEEAYADTSFEDGKKGVQVIIAENNKTSMAGTTLVDTIETTETEVFFTEAVFYHQWVKKNRMFDITEAVNEKLTDFGEDKSIAEKMEEDLLNSLTVDGKVYALPYWMGSYGITYNATLFDENNWYYSADGSFTNASGSLSAGPDGQNGTYDDGMPATYDQFYALLDEINRDNVTPLQWAGASPDYFSWFLSSLFADYEGYDDFMLNYTLDGTTQLVKPGTVNAETGAYETEEVTITNENGYELARQEGLLVTLEFAQKILRGMGYYYDANTALSGSFKQQDAQLAFVRNATSSSNKPVAMILEGSWWENEATTAFEATYGTGATKYDSEFEYKYLPLPKANESLIGSENLWVSPLESYCFLNPNISKDKVELATTFLQFCHTDESMTEFTSTTGILKPYEYEIDESKVTPYVQSVLDATEKSRVVFPKSNNDLYTYSPNSFWGASLYTVEYESGKYSWNVTLPLTQKDGETYTMDYAECFDGLLTYRKDNLWTTFDAVLK